MNCKNVEELLPLYVGRDLEAERARQINAHIQSCMECARSEQDYVEADQLFKALEPPQFSETTYAAVRSNVLREIERKSSATGLMEFLKRPLSLRVTWAVSAAVMVVVCAFAYYFLADRMSQPGYRPQLTANSGGGQKDPRDERVNTGTPAGVLPSPAKKPQRTTSNLLAKASRNPLKAGRTPAVPVTSASYSPAESKDTSLNTPATSDKTLRLEIQTSNPNIRIIWFSHPPNTEGSPNESSKGI
jgi:anti-sigma factor RsiW